MSLELFALTDRIAIVTGAGRGIGKALALGLADAGAQVVVAARTAAQIEATAAEIEARGRRALAITTDVRDSHQVANLVAKTVAAFGGVDILVNNAGGSFRAPTLEMSENAWDALIRENLKSVFLCSQAAAREMVKQRRGNIINISSLAGQSPQPGAAHYAAAKAGILNLTQTLAIEWGPYNIRVNAIAPGLIETEGAQRLYRKHPEVREAEAKKVPLRRIGTPQDIVGAAIYLTSEASAYVTGSTLVISGGLTGFVF